ncbi:MarR family winged helix-turn-helix transcriptional regulator [Mycolicibacter arupensis]|jgi:DNA-binding MarR family transcriptional regulator|uniref:MarR family transcriptional regulator n=1 Tax=Mycolicibacter arupensis TaxID=342002 RepID=A0A5C7XYE0_9MYCO|nr:MarR family transcriptional regulator [Mycolicibacter arupensis]TXI54595.1 MAG: MarR family transcriptional regulator [Mycolicibacter arupensis]
MHDAMALLVADLYQAAGLARRRGEQIAKSAGQTQARWQVLSVVSDGPRTVAQAARRLGTARQAVQRVANELAQQGLLRALDNPDHRTSPLFTLTDEGAQILQRMNSAAAVEHRAQLEALGPDETAHIHDGLRRLVAILEQA